MGPLLGWTAARGRIEWPGVALFAILFVWQFPHFMSIAWLYRDDYARAGIRMLPVVQPDGWSTVVEALFYAVLMIPVSLAPWWLGVTSTAYVIRRRPARPRLSRLHHPLRRHPPRQDRKTRAACWPAICSKSASSICRCSSPRSCSAPRQRLARMTDDRTHLRSALQHRPCHRRHSRHQRRRLRSSSSGSSIFIPPRPPAPNTHSFPQ